ncbi:carboxymuconolactone decarboxylase family protein [Streptosporangium sp. NBC_01639]|uniref:hypothetical protein n=1 Tax=Streptosporangium sp. NBC_01639 TaxID=2975948 RepID=UPI003869453A|nr:carboxymuconolactone decarboxylase family protein [Streptosporangium sp. NBC_01639]
MEPRLNLFGSPLAAKSMKYFASASKVIIDGSMLPTATQDLVMLRASQINGCGTTSPASSDNEDSPVWKECHELSA